MSKLKCAFPKAVRVRQYPRIRFGKLENVREHCRGLPTR